MTAVRCAAITPRWISSCSIRSWLRSAVSSGSSVARCWRAIAQARLEPVEERLVPRPVLASALDLVESRLVGGGPGERRLVAVGLDRRPTRPNAGPSGSVSPWPTSVTRITAKVRKRIRSRSGKVGRQREGRRQRDGSPEAGPAHDEREPRGQPRVASRRSARRGDPGQEARGEDPHDPRDDDDARRRAAARPRIWLGGRSPRLSRICGNSRPISTKTKPLRTNPIIFQVVSHRTRLLGVRIVPRRLPMTRPAVTAASTPDEPEPVGREIGRERDDHRDQDLDGRVVEPAEDLAGHAADDAADDDPAGGGDHEARQRFGQDEGAADGREHGRPVGDERGRIVEQRLAFDQRPDDPRRPEPAEDRSWRRARRSAPTIAPSVNAAGQPRPGTSGMGHRGDDDHREEHEADRQAERAARGSPAGPGSATRRRR